MSYLVVTLNWLALFTEIPLMRCLSERESTMGWRKGEQTRLKEEARFKRK